jgi:hypothetical protein
MYMCPLSFKSINLPFELFNQFFVDLRQVVCTILALHVPSVWVIPGKNFKVLNNVGLRMFDV